MAAIPTKLKVDNYLLSKVIESNPLYLFRQAQTPIWSLRLAAFYIGVTQTTVQKWESGIVFPNDENFRSIARVMNKTYEQLLVQWQVWDKQKKLLLSEALVMV